MVTITKQRIQPDILVLKLAGRLGMGRASEELQYQIEELLAKQERKLILDLSDLKYMDSTGLGMVIFSRGKLTESGGQLYIAGANEIIRNLFKITGVDQVLSLYPGAEEAAQAFTAS